MPSGMVASFRSSGLLTTELLTTELLTTELRSNGLLTTGVPASNRRRAT
jgi:hypothetical protein